MSAQKSPKKVLLIEDEDAISEMYKVKFEKEGFQFLRAVEGMQGIELAKKEKPDIILLDVIMPKIDGFSVLKTLKTDKATQKAKVILLTNLGQDEDIQKGKDMGADDYLVKANFTPTQIVEKVRQLIG